MGEMGKDVTLSHFAHPQEVLTGLVNGNIFCIHSLCSNKEYINCRVKQLYMRLLVHGYQLDLLIPAFTKGITGARAFINRIFINQYTLYQDKDTKVCVLFHLNYHPRYPTSNTSSANGPSISYICYGSLPFGG